MRRTALAVALTLATGVSAIVFSGADATAAGPRTAPLTRIVYYSGTNPRGLWTMNVDGSSPAPLLSASTGTAAGANFSADGSKLVYQVGGGVACNVNYGPGQIIVANADGSSPVTIGSGCSPRISPDGTRVLYLAGPVNGVETPLYVDRVSDPTHPQQILPTPNCDAWAQGAYPSYPNNQSVCNSQIAAWVDNNTIVTSGYQNGLWELPATGGNPHPILSGADQSSDWYSGLSVSPDASTIAGYPLSQTAGGFQLVTVPAGGGSLKPLYTQAGNSSDSYDYPQWLDNQTLVMRHSSGSGANLTNRIAVSSASSFAPHDLNPSDTNSAFPAPAPPGGMLTVSGTVADIRGAGLSGVNVAITGATSSGTAVSVAATTGPGGSWSTTLMPGTYNVAPTGTPPTEKTKGIYQVKRCDGTATVTSVGDVCQVSGTGAKQADFAFKPSDHVLALSFSPGSVDTTGTGHFTGVAKDVDKTGAPVTGESISFTPPLDVSPRALVCSPTGLVYPRLLSDGSPLGSGFGLSTDSGGLVPLSVWVGTTPGQWLLEADETGDSSVATSLGFPFPDRGAGTFAPGGIAEDLYRAARNTVGGSSGINLFSHFAATGQAEASSQAVLMAFLALNLSRFPGADFGPAHAGGRAGVVFYRHGTTDPSLGVVLGIDQAAAIIDAAGSGKAIPDADRSLPSLAGWAADHGADPHSALGSLAPPPSEGLLYFGFPYPPLVNSAAAEVSFYGPCLQPDPALEEVQTHSPVALTFSGAHGYRLGLSAKGRAVGNGRGFVVRNGDQVTYVLPTGSYHVAVAATGSGPATIVSLAPGRRAISAGVFTLRVRRGQHGAFALGRHGAGTVLRIGRQRLHLSVGLPLSLNGLPHRLRRGATRTLKLRLRSLGAPVAGALITVTGHARAAAVTDGGGVAAVTVRPAKGAVTVKVTASGHHALRRVLSAR